MLRITIDCPTWMTRVAVSSVPLLMIGFAGVALGVPKTFTNGQLLTAADLNANFEQLPTVTEWVAYTPEVTAGSPPGTAIATTTVPDLPGVPPADSPGYWRRVGDTMEVRLDTFFPTCSMSGQLLWSLPAGYTVDAAKLSGHYDVVGTGTTVNPGTGAVLNTNVVATHQLPLIGIQPATGGTGTCAVIGSGGEARLQFAVPIQGWTATN